MFSLDDAKTNGITETGINEYAYKHVKAFYDEAGNGAELWVMVVASSITMAEMADKTEAYAKALLDEAKGNVRLLGITRKSASGVTIANGVDEDVDDAVTNAQALIEEFAATFKAASVIIDGKDFNGNVADLKDYTTATSPFVSVALANSDGSNNASIGLLLGRLAKDPVHRNPARVKSGELPTAYLTDGTALRKAKTAGMPSMTRAISFYEHTLVVQATILRTHQCVTWRRMTSTASPECVRSTKPSALRMRLCE